MSSTQTCRTCGAPLSLGSSGAYCPACALQVTESASDEALDLEESESLPRQFGLYELLARLGHGGMGLVYKARQTNLDRIVALKVLLTGRFSDAQTKARFKREAETAARLQHPNIVAIHDVGEADGHPFLTMDFVDGPNLAELCDGRPLAAMTAAEFTRDIARAVHAAHQAGILHRDLKPSNVMVGSDARVRVTDFGIAKCRDDAQDLTVSGQMLGSPNYASPEQAGSRSSEIGVPSDVYGLGALLYHLVTGRAPFSAPSAAETLRLVLDADPVSPRLLNPGLTRDLETVCLKCLHKDPARRYQSAAEVAEELDRVLTHRPILARPTPAIERVWHWSRRHPGTAGLAAAVVCALTLTSIVLFVSAQRIEHARAKESAARLVAEENLYAANMEVIAGGFAAALGHDVRDTRVRLEAARPGAGARDFRGFEWRYYWKRNQSDALATLSGHKNVVDAVAYAPDGTRVASHSFDGTLRVWDSTSGKELQLVEGVMRLGGFSPDGRSIHFSRPDNSVWRLDATGTPVQELAATGRLVAVHPDGAQVVVLGEDQLPVLCALNSTSPPKPLAEVPVDTMAVMSRDGRRAAVAGRPYPGILVIDLESRKQIAAIIDPRPVIAIAISPDGTQLVSSGFDAVLKVWDVATGRQVHAFKPFLDGDWGLAYSADGALFAAGGHNRVIKVWRTSDWEETEALAGHESTIDGLAFAPDGRRLASGAEDNTAMIWPIGAFHPKDEMRQALRGPRWIDQTPGMAFSPDSKLFAGTAADGTIKVWQADTLNQVATFHEDAQTVAFSKDGGSLMSQDANGAVHRWSLSDPARPPESIFTPDLGLDNWHLDAIPVQKRVEFVAQHSANTAMCHLCDIMNARDSINAGTPVRATTLASSPDGSLVYAGMPDGTVEVWDVATRSRRFSFAAHKLPVTAIAISADGKLLGTGGLDNSTGIWDAATGEPIARIYVHNRPVWALAFSPDGQTLAAGSCDKAIVLCSVALRRHVATLPLYTSIPEGYEQEVRLLSFSPDGNILAAALGDGSVRFFRAASFAEADAAAGS